MTTETEAAAVANLKAEIDAAIARLDCSKGSPHCGAHDAVAQGTRTLLRCYRAKMDERRLSWDQVTALGAVAGAVVAGFVAVVQKML